MNKAKMNNFNCLLSIVIITKNEEANIARSIESALKATTHIEKSEIILVDSASTDRTVEIAMKYPIRILQLHPSWPLSPSAGCYIGFLHSTGKYIQVIGGDMILDENWLEHALPVLEKNDKVAGVSGRGSQEIYNTKMSKDYENYYANMQFGEVNCFAGATLFKRYVLLDVGPFNPFLRAGEEGELCYRVVNRGYKLLALPFHMTHHLGFKKAPLLSTVMKEIRYTIAQGQILKYSLNDKKIFWWRLKEYKFKIFSILLISFASIGSIAYFKSGIIMPFYLLSLCILIYFLWVLYTIRNFKRALRHAASQALRSIHFAWGFLLPKKNPGIYPTDVRVIK